MKFARGFASMSARKIKEVLFGSLRVDGGILGNRRRPA
jgi:hypothetical protein